MNKKHTKEEIMQVIKEVKEDLIGLLEEDFPALERLEIICKHYLLPIDGMVPNFHNETSYGRCETLESIIYSEEVDRYATYTWWDIIHKRELNSPEYQKLVDDCLYMMNSRGICGFKNDW